MAKDGPSTFHAHVRGRHQRKARDAPGGGPHSHYLVRTRQKHAKAIQTAPKGLWAVQNGSQTHENARNEGGGRGVQGSKGAKAARRSCFSQALHDAGVSAHAGGSPARHEHVAGHCRGEARLVEARPRSETAAAKRFRLMLTRHRAMGSACTRSCCVPFVAFSKPPRQPRPSKVQGMQRASCPVASTLA